MSQYLHIVDRFGHSRWFGHPELRLPAQPIVHDYDKQVQILKELELRHDDVITVAYPKSGTNWINHIVCMLLDGTTEIQPILSDEFFNYMDLVGFDKHLPPADKPRALWSHLRLRDMPRDVIDKKVKVVYLTRNPKDVFVSLFCHLQHFTDTNGYTGTWPQFFEIMLHEGWWYGDIFDYLRDWEQHPELPILQLSYEDMKQDLPLIVEKLNEFLETGRSKDFCHDVARTCQFPNMHVTRKFSEDAVRSFDWDDSIPTTSFFRKGVVGDWKNWFTVAQNEEFEKVYKAKMAGSKLQFRFE